MLAQVPGSKTLRAGSCGSLGKLYLGGGAPGILGSLLNNLACVPHSTVSFVYMCFYKMCIKVLCAYTSNLCDWNYVMDITLFLTFVPQHPYHCILKICPRCSVRFSSHLLSAVQDSLMHVPSFPTHSPRGDPRTASLPPAEISTVMLSGQHQAPPLTGPCKNF